MPLIHLNYFYLVPDVNGLFQLWNGYVESESNFHYSRFYGFQSDGSECWVLERSEAHSAFIPVSFVQARELINSFVGLPPAPRRCSRCGHVAELWTCRVCGHDDRASIRADQKCPECGFAHAPGGNTCCDR